MPRDSRALGNLRRFFGGRSAKRRARKEAAAASVSSSGASVFHDGDDGTGLRNHLHPSVRHGDFGRRESPSEDDTDYDTASEGDTSEAFLRHVLKGGDEFRESHGGVPGYGPDGSVGGRESGVPSTSMTNRSSFDGVLPRAGAFVASLENDNAAKKSTQAHWSADVRVLDWLKVRAPGYLTQKRKQVPGTPVLECVDVDLFTFDDGHQNDVARHRPESWLNIERETWHGMGKKLEEMPWTFVFQFQNPGPPCVSIACYFQPTGTRAGMNLSQLLAFEHGTPFGTALSRFLRADHKTRDTKFKVTCALMDAPWALRAAVPRRPVILGKKLGKENGLKYFQSSNHLEVDFELGLSKFMERVYRALKWASALSSEEIVFSIEGQAEDELPEAVLGAVSLKKIGERAFMKLNPISAEAGVAGVAGSSASDTNKPPPTEGGGG